jgi:2-keto-4-pentenoate hydratase
MERAVDGARADERHAATARAAEALLHARATRSRLTALPDGTAPTADAEAYAIQNLVAQQLGPVAGWKVGAATATAAPFRAPLHAATLWADGDRLPAGAFHLIGIEAEIVYRLAHDLPPRERPYARAEVLAAIGTMHPAIEIVDSRFVDLALVDGPSQRADQQNHGALAVGPARQDWSGIDPVHLLVRLSIDGVVRAEAVGGNSAGDPVRLLEWLANGSTRSLGGLRAGQVITTGSCTGTIFVPPGVRVAVDFAGLGRVEIEIARDPLGHQRWETHR